MTGRISTLEYQKIISGKGAAKTGTQRKKINREEEDLQRAIIKWSNENAILYPCLMRLFHPANGGGRSPAEGGILKACGVRKGVPDLMLPLPSAVTYGLAVELKSSVGELTEEQQGWLLDLHSSGYVVGVARTIDEFWILFDAYLTGWREGLPGYSEIFGEGSNK